MRDGKDANLLETVALDLGYNGTPEELSNDVQQAMNESTANASWDPTTAAQ